MDQPSPVNPTVSIMKACELAGVSRRTIYNWMKAGKVQWVRNAGGAVRIFSASLFYDGPRGSNVADPKGGVA
jgi:excisionase family DNA binding protein